MQQLTDLGSKALELGDPVGHCGEWRDNEERTFDLLLHQVRYERDALDRLAQTHLVSQNPVYPVLVDDLKQ